MTEPSDLSLAQLAVELRAGGLTARELAERALSSMHYGAYIEVDPDRTLVAAEAADAAFRAGLDHGLLQGIPISVKDLYGVPGFATRAGSPRRLPTAFEAPGPVVGSALRQLALVMGKTHTVEFAFGGVGTNPHYPTPRNPRDAGHHRAPGGSTSGGGVSLCEGSAFLALGTDTAGSVRIPAAWTGNAAIKTTKGRWSTAGIVPLSPTLDTAGILARTVEDLCFGFLALDPTASGLPQVPEISSLRLGRCDDLFFEGCSPGVVDAVDRALSELTSAGARIEELDLPELRPTFELFKQGGPVSVELYHFLSTELPEWLDTLDTNVRVRIGAASELRAYEYLDRLRQMRRRAASVANRLRRVDLLVSPTVANTPPRLSDIATPETYGPQNLLSLRNTSLVSYLGLCAVTLPVGKDAAGMPVGLQLIARGGGDERLLSIALAVERLLGSGA
jgi:aspartyl-tRNA(Asn)/glutamyl-tRNA(Gln) amidotransferase subunit A